MKKLVSFLMVFVILVTGLSACKKQDEESMISTDSNEITDQIEVPYNPAIDDLYYDQKEITFLYSDFDDMSRNEFEGEMSEDSIEKAIYSRNMQIEEKFGVLLSFKTTVGADIQTDVRNVIGTQDPTIDIYGAYAAYGLGLSVERAFEDLNSLSYLDVENSWWNQSWNQESIYNNHLYGVVGDINNSLFLKTIATFVNQNLLTDYKNMNSSDLYSVVNSGKWTIEYMMELAKDVYDDNGMTAGERDMLDTYGLAIGQISHPAQALVQGSDFTWTTTDDNGTMFFDMYNEKNMNILDKIQGMFKSNAEGVYVLKGGEIPGVYYYATLFSKANLMMTMAPMFTAENLIQTEIDYFILPVPKAEESQDRYISTSQDSHTFCAISSVSDAKEASGAILEYMGYLTERDITPLYIDTTYKVRYASDTETMKMFDQIVDSIEFKFAVNWQASLNYCLKTIRSLAADPTQPIASSLEAANEQCQAYLESLIEKMDELHLYE